MAKDKAQTRKRTTAKFKADNTEKRSDPSPITAAARDAPSSRLDSVVAFSLRWMPYFVLTLWALGIYILFPQWTSGETAIESPFAVVDLPGRGKGLVATRDIEQGELLIREKPLFVVPREIKTSPANLIAQLVSNLNLTEQESFFGLSYVNLPENIDPKTHTAEVALAIFQTNAVAAGSGVGIFPRMARLNHGCSSSFNSVYSWREKEQELVVYALKSIPKGEELLTSYLDTKKPRGERRSYLQEHYGFECKCRTCSLSENASRASDARLLAISEAYGRFAEWGNQKIGGQEAVDLVRKIWQLEDEEGYWSERGRLAADAAWVAASHSDESAAREWARQAVTWYTYEIGGDTEQVTEMQRVVARPELHSPWGTREHKAVGRPANGPK